MLTSLFDTFDKLIVLDTETTGFSARDDEIIELGFLALTADGAEREEDLLIRLSPGRRLPPRITELTGITEGILASRGVEKEQAGRALADVLRGGRPLVAAYNAQFDLCFLFYFLRQLGMEDSLRAARFLDVMTVYKDRRDYPHRLQNAVDAYAVAGENTHRACDDARATLGVLAAMENERADLAEYINLFGYDPGTARPSPAYPPSAMSHSPTSAASAFMSKKRPCFREAGALGFYGFIGERRNRTARRNPADPLRSRAPA